MGAAARPSDGLHEGASALKIPKLYRFHSGISAALS
jgi:hypothetical protein